MDRDKRQKLTTNISKEEEAALKKSYKRHLHKDHSSEGNATVVMDFEAYETKVEEVLNQGKYRLLPKEHALYTKLPLHHSKLHTS